MTRCLISLLPYFFKSLYCTLFALLIAQSLQSQCIRISDSLNKRTYIYAVKGADTLRLDVYQLKNFDTTQKRPCIIFIFGGAFMAGRRDDTMYYRFYNALAERGYTVTAITYRLGLKGVKHVSKFDIKPLRMAIDEAVEDTYDATSWVVNHAPMLGVDTAQIIVSGSSAGAITALEADFQLRNDKPVIAHLPAHFSYAGVISFSGAVLSFDGALKYARPPAPTLMFHGSGDRIVPYKKIRFFNKGFYGSYWIAKCFKEKGYPYYFFSEQDMGHEISILPMNYNLPLVLDFIDHYVIQKKRYMVDVNFKDPDQKPLFVLTAQELMKKLDK